MSEQQITVLVDRFFRGAITAEEKEALAQWIQEPGNDNRLNELLQQSWNTFETTETLNTTQANELLHSILVQAKAIETTPAPVVAISSRRWMRIAVAAAVLAVLATTAWWFFIKPAQQNEIVHSVKPANDIPAPLTNKAMITLADGSKIYLDKNSNGQLASQDNVELLKTSDGKIKYQSHGSVGAAEIYNTLTNPQGSNVIDMTLADGTRVWLNAGSSLTYPVAFKNSERKVQVSGEAYFEVAHDANKPFYVSMVSSSGNRREDKGEVQVLGTHFNVNAYDNEAEAKVTLLEGRVRVAQKAQEGILKPGQQAILLNDSRLTSHDSRFTIHDNIDTESVTAWRNGKFLFEDAADIKVIMRQIARWYDVEVVYEGNVHELIGGSISRSENLSQVLKMLELTGTVHFTVEGKRVIVKP